MVRLDEGAGGRVCVAVSDVVFPDPGVAVFRLALRDVRGGLGLDVVDGGCFGGG